MNVLNAFLTTFQVEFDLAQVKRTKEHVGLNIRIIQRAQANRSSNKSQENGDQTKNEAQTNGDAAKVHKGFVASLKDTFGFIETLSHDKEIFFHYRLIIFFLFYFYSGY